MVLFGWLRIVNGRILLFIKHLSYELSSTYFFIIGIWPSLGLLRWFSKASIWLTFVDLRRITHRIKAHHFEIFKICVLKVLISIYWQTVGRWSSIIWLKPSLVTLILIRAREGRVISINQIILNWNRRLVYIIEMGSLMCVMRFRSIFFPLKVLITSPFQIIDTLCLHWINLLWLLLLI